MCVLGNGAGLKVGRCILGEPALRKRFEGDPASVLGDTALDLPLEFPDAALKELGRYLEPPVGKSGVNHRLRKLSEIADRIRL